MPPVIERQIRQGHPHRCGWPLEVVADSEFVRQAYGCGLS